MTSVTTKWSEKQLATAALLTAIAYWLGARLGLALTFPPTPVSVLWPPNAILLAALIVAPVSTWWLLLLSALPAHVYIELNAGIPPVMVASWFVSNCFEALVGAGLLRLLLPGRVRLDTTEAFGLFVVCAALFATLVSSFLDAAFVAWNGWGGSSYWTVWQVRFLSNVLATQTIVPVILAVTPRTMVSLFRMSPRRRLEVGALGVALVLTCGVAFWVRDWHDQVGPTLLFAPIPILLWAAVRFGPIGVSFALGATTFLAVWGTARGGGPFASLEPTQNAVSLQLFLFLTGIPLVLLATTSQGRRRAERKAAESERMLAMTIKAAHIGLWTVDLQTERFAADEVLVGMMGDPEMQHASYEGLIDVAPARRVRTSGERSLGDETADQREARRNVDTIVPERELEVTLPDGTVRWVLARGVLLRHPDGRPYCGMGIAMDISERKRVEQAMREYDDRLSLAAASADIGFWSLEIATGEVWLSDQCYTMLGTEISGDPEGALEFLIPEVSIGDSAATIDRIFGRRGTLARETKLERPEHGVRWIVSSARVERTAAGEPLRIIGVSRDISDRREAERQAGERQLALAHLSRVATVGELTATVVHEVGQPLGAITLNAQAALRLANDREIDVEELRNVTADLVRDARRAATVIGQLRDLLRRDEQTRERIDLGIVVQDTLNLARGELAKQDISLVVSIPDEGPMVLANRAQLQQVLLNVILNARDAINAAPPHRRQMVVSVTRGPGTQANVWVADSGGGIAREHLTHVFEPFFTSKPEGLGLGLAVSRSIMLDHGGDLRAENVEGGALLQVVLPEAQRRPPRTSGPERRAPSYTPPPYPPSGFLQPPAAR